MAFLGQLTANVQAQLNSVKPQLNSVLQTASRARDNLAPILNRATAQLDNLGKILQAGRFYEKSEVIHSLMHDRGRCCLRCVN